VSQVTLARNRSLHFLDNHSGHDCRHSATRILHLEPVGRAAGTVGGILALRDDAFKTHFASVREDGRAVAFDMLVEPDAGAGLSHDGCERGLADLERVTAQIIAIQFDQVEGVQEHVPVMLAVADTLERCEPVVIARDGFPIDDAGARAQPSQGLHDQREAIG